MQNDHVKLISSIYKSININDEAPENPKINGGFRGLAVAPPGIELH